MVQKPIVVTRDDSGNVLSIIMVRPSNFHAHLRADHLMRAIAYAIMWWVKYLLVMPNTGPIDTIQKVVAYHQQLCELADKLGLSDVEFIMTIYATEKLTPTVIQRLMQLPFRCVVKWYPPQKGATTGSGSGIPLEYMHETLLEMQRCQMRLLGHFEDTLDYYGRPIEMPGREGHFMDYRFPWLREKYPELLINIEHGSTIKAVDRVKEDPSGNTTIGFTPHHLLLPLDELLEKPWANHGRCMPILKTQDDVDCCLEFAASGDTRAHLGDDTAAHLSQTKVDVPFEDAACGCWLPHSIAMYAFVFEKIGALDERFVKFACWNAPDTWGLPRPDANDTITLVRDTENDIPDPTEVPEENDVVIPLGWHEDMAERMKLGLALH